MQPVLFHVSGIPVWSHAVFTLLGTLVALGVSWWLATRHGRATHQFVWVLSGGLMGAALLAKFGLAPRYLLDADAPSLRGLLLYQARTLLGGLAGAYVGVVLTKRLVGYRGHTGDLLTPGVAIGIAIGRVGCHLAERPGTATTLPWGVMVPMPLPPTVVGCDACLAGLPMHPSFLYESLLLLVLGFWAFPYARDGRLPRRWMREGDLFTVFLLVYAPGRFLMEFVRGNPVMALGLSGSQLAVLVATPLLVWRLRAAFRPSSVVLT